MLISNKRILTLCFLFLLIPLFSFFLFHPNKKKKSDPFLFAYHVGDGAGGLHLAWSEDGFKWTPVKGGKAIVKPGIGDYVLRDPHISQSADGMFHMVWATGIARKDIGYAHSKNLIDWSVQRLIPVMEKDTLVLNAWSPELVFDPYGSRFMLYWTSTVPGKFKTTDMQNDSLSGRFRYNHRIYRKLSTDLLEWTPTEIFFEPGFNVADATICTDSGKVMMFYKDATQLGKNIQNNIKMSTSGVTTGGFSTTPALVSRRVWAEAPTGVRVDSQFVVYFNKFKTKKMGAVATKDFKKWKDVSDSLSFPKGIQHGCVFRVQEKILDKLKDL